MPSPSVALLRTQSDLRLVALAASGHERAFEAIVERYRRQLLRHARRYLPEARAEDAVQQALVSAWTALRRGDEVRELRPWLHRIVHNVALNALRAPGYDYDELRATLQGSGGPAELAERRAVVRSTLAGLAALPERQRQALLQIAVEGRSQDEVAEQLGLSQGAVRQLVHRARTTLRAAATALVPLPFATWLAGAGRGDVAVRVGELVAGAGGSATLAKAGAVAVLAGGAVAGPAVVHDVSDRRPVAESDASARADADRARATASTPAAPAPVAVVAQRDAPGGDDARPRRGNRYHGEERPDRDTDGRRDGAHDLGHDDEHESDDGDTPAVRRGDRSGSQGDGRLQRDGDRGSGGDDRLQRDGESDGDRGSYRDGDDERAGEPAPSSGSGSRHFGSGSGDDEPDRPDDPPAASDDGAAPPQPGDNSPSQGSAEDGP